MKIESEKRGFGKTEAEFSFSYDFSSFLAYYSKIFSLAGLSRLTGINQGQLSHYLTGRTTPSKKTIMKIQSAIHALSAELSQVNFVWDIREIAHKGTALCTVFGASVPFQEPICLKTIATIPVVLLWIFGHVLIEITIAPWVIKPSVSWQIISASE